MGIFSSSTADGRGKPVPLGQCCRPALAQTVQAQYKQLGGWLTASQVPIVYSPVYNIGFLGVEKLHPFDSQKFGKVAHSLQNCGLLLAKQFVQPLEASQEILRDVHSVEYLRSIDESSHKLAEITETPPIRFLLNSLVQYKLNRPMRYHVGGTILAVALALEYGWSINLGGGMHHAYHDNGGGWCVYDDWTLALRMLRRTTGNKVQKAILIDLDVHQGNGHARDKLHFKDDDLYIFDVYNSDIWPWDTAAKAAINCDRPIHTGTGDAEYLSTLKEGLSKAFAEFSPDICLYNAGTDILAGDPLGLCNVSAEAVAERDELVFEAAKAAGIPICMALSGGYARNSAQVISKCIEHVIRKHELIVPLSKA